MLYILSGNIVGDEILQGKDVFILPTNTKMRFGSGVSGAVFKKAGVKELEKYCEETFNTGYKEDQKENDMKPMEIRITPGFGLGMDIIFAQGPRYFVFDKDYDEKLKILTQTYINALNTVKEKGYKNAILPALGTGHYGFKHEDVSKNIIPILNKFTKENGEINIYLCLIDQQTADIYVRELESER